MKTTLYSFFKIISLTFFCIALIKVEVNGQIGGQHVYDFLNLPASARVNALGGNLITVKDDDASLAFHNPSLLNPSMHQELFFNTGLYVAGINFGYTGYAHHVDKWKTTLHGAMQYISYGKFIQADITGTNTGEFKSSEIALTTGAGYQYSDKLSFGANLKLVYSKLESYNSVGLSTDLGVTFADTTSNFTATLVFKNVGLQLSAYDDQREPLPFDVQFGISKRLKHVPFRFSVIAHHLQRWNILYDDPDSVEQTSLFGEEINDRSNFSLFIDNFFRHFIFNGEVLIGKNDVFKLRLGYNHLRKAELSVKNLGSFAGFSTGVGIKIKQFRIDYGIAFYHLAGNLNQFTLSTNINRFK